LESKSSVEESFHHIVSDRKIGWKLCALFDHNRIDSIQHLPAKLHISGPPGSIVDWYLWISKNGGHLLVVVQLCDVLRLQLYLGSSLQGGHGKIDALDLLKAFIMRQIIYTVINV
jgi:hypothetical protein